MQKKELRMQDRKVPECLAATSVRIKNFRGFSDVSLDDVRRINVLVGDNGVGKTAFLEALYLVASSSPDKILGMRHARNLPIGVETAFSDDVWITLLEDLFHNFDTKQPVYLSVEGSDDFKRSLQIFHEIKPTVVSLNGKPGGLGPVQSPISFLWKDDDQNEGTVITPEVNETEGRLIIPRAPNSNIVGRIFRPGTVVSPDAEDFSMLRRAGKHKEFLEEIKKQFPDIEDMSVEVSRGKSLIYAQRKYDKRPMPITLISDGLSKIFNVLLSFTAIGNRRSVLFADELDNGIYFERHELFWRQINALSRKFSTQLFASVHSEEFLRAMLPVAKEYPEDFSIIRIFRKEGQNERKRVSKAAIVRGPKVVNLIESGLEVR